MPVADEPIKSSWADEVEAVEDFPPPLVKTEGNTKTVTEYTMLDDKKVKVISYYKIEKHKVSKSIAQRKTWKKFGLSRDDKPGPNPGTTITAEEVQMQFISAKEEEVSDQEELKKRLIEAQKGQVKCRLCKEDHWTKQCPYKDKLEPLRSSLLGEEEEKEDPSPAAPAPDKKAGGGITGSKYVIPSMRDGASKKGETMMSSRNRDETATLRVTNLSENANESDIKTLFKEFGEINRIYLAKDKITGASKGFAFVSFKSKGSANAAIDGVNGHGYDHLILNVEWSKPSGTQ